MRKTAPAPPSAGLDEAPDGQAAQRWPRADASSRKKREEETWKADSVLRETLLSWFPAGLSTVITRRGFQKIGGLPQELQLFSV